MPRAAIFLDRDGTIIEDAGYPNNPKQVQLIPGAGVALVALSQLVYALVVVSNQSGVGRGIITAQQAKLVHQRFIEVLAQANVQIDASYYCYHSPDDECICRKPAIGMLECAATELDIALNRSVMIGDKLTDILAGQRAQCQTVLLCSSKSDDDQATSVKPDFYATDWSDIVQFISANVIDIYT